MKYYILSDRDELTETEDVLEWARWFEKAERQIRRTKYGSFEISTIFLGLDHSFIPDNPPLLFETAVKERGSGAWVVIKRHTTMYEAIMFHLRTTEDYCHQYGVQFNQVEYIDPRAKQEPDEAPVYDISPLDIFD